MYHIEFSEKADKQLTKLDASIQKRIIDVLERISIRPFHFIKRKEGSPFYILRVGVFRAILDILQDKQQIMVIEVGHRRNIYK